MDLKQDEYLTIRKLSKGLYKEKGSKFISLAYPAKTREEVKGILFSLRKEYHDARHHSYAYRLGTTEDNYRINDDGEPSGTAGKPIFGQIQSFQLRDILVVVVRYFGGTKLGVSGLITAYKNASKDALLQSDIIRCTVNIDICLSFEYPDLDHIMRLIKERGPSIENQNFDLQCSMKLSIRQSLSDTFLASLNKIPSVRIVSCE